MAINKKLSVRGCWKMVNAIQNAKTLEEVRERCAIAQDWLKENEVIDNEAYDELMMAVSFIYRETYHTA